MGVPEDVNTTAQLSAHASDARGGVNEKDFGSEGVVTPVDSEPKDYIDPKEERAFVCCTLLCGQSS